jgi:hypothetical protein
LILSEVADRFSTVRTVRDLKANENAILENKNVEFGFKKGINNINNIVSTTKQHLFLSVSLTNQYFIPENF